MQFAVYFARSCWPRRLYRRIKTRNSSARFRGTGYASAERIWWLGYECAIEWGKFDPNRPDLQVEANRMRRAVKRARDMPLEILQALDRGIAATRKRIDDER